MTRVRKLVVLSVLLAAAAVVAASRPHHSASAAHAEARAYFVGDFDTGDLSQWRDFHDAHLSSSPPGFEVVASPRYGSAGYAARVTVLDRSDSSVGGDLSMLWDGDGGNSYGLPYLQNGHTTWFRIQFAIPDGTHRSFPGKLTPSPGSWAIIYTWHTNPYRVPTAYSSYLGIRWGRNARKEPSALVFRTVGGKGDGTKALLYQTDGAPQKPRNRIPLRYNRWYDALIRITFGPTAGTGSVRWWIDGVEQTPANCPTIAVASDGSTPGVGHEVGFYRGPSQPYADTMYIDGVKAGPTAAAVGVQWRTRSQHPARASRVDCRSKPSSP